MELNIQSQKTEPNLGPDQEELFIEAQKAEENETYPEALKKYHEIIDGNPSRYLMFECLKNMGNIYLKLGDFDAAEESYCKAQRIDGDHEGLIVNFGVLAMQKGDFEAAKDYFRQVIGKDDASDIAWVGIGLVHRAHSDFDLARGCMLRALDAEPTNKTALVTYYQWCEDDVLEPSLEPIENYLQEEPNDQEIIDLLQKFKSL